VQWPACIPQGLREVPHSAQEQGDALFARPNVCGLFAGFGHPNRVLLWVKAVEGCRVEVELVAQNKN
jgi:hypothetical protein